MGTAEEELHDRRTLNNTMLSLLEENRDTIKTIALSIDETKGVLVEINEHFVGIQPSEHIKHHLKLEQESKDELEFGASRRAVIVALIIVALTGIGSIMYSVISSHIKLEFITQIETAEHKIPNTK